MPLDSELVRGARDLAERAHAGQLRKDGRTPYFLHPESVARRLVALGHDDDTLLAAAYLHDVLEDCPAFADELRAITPREVVEIVERLTERKLDEQGRKREKRARFADYVEGLHERSEVARRAAVVSCADKLDNLRSLIDAERERPSGRSLLRELSTRPGEHRGQLHALRRVYAPVVGAAMLEAFDEAVEELAALLETWLVGHAVAIAATAHVGQLDKAGRPYVEHPLRLMARAQTHEQKMTAVLHDVLEDTPWSLEALAREGIPRRVLRALRHLTKREGEPYEAFIERVAEDGLATRVKVLDLEDNADLSRLARVTRADEERAEKYRQALARLRPETKKRSLYVVLDHASRRAVRRLATHVERHGDHVTLARKVRTEELAPAWVPGGAQVGERVEVRAVALAEDERVQALEVEIAGASRRPFDGGRLHVTVSVAEGAEPNESNALLARAVGRPLELELVGVVAWVD